MLHFLTNFILALRLYGLLSNDLVFIGVVLFEVALFVALFWVYRADLKKRGNVS